MDEHLKLLIVQYEAEQQTLQLLLNECLAEEDYKFAKYYHKHLRRLEKTLFNLYSLSDYNHSQKTELQKRLSNMELIKSKENLHSPFIEREIKNLQTKLSQLNELAGFEVEEKYDIENAIIYLLEEKINGFKLIILKKGNLYLDFSFPGEDTIHIQFTPFNKLAEYAFTDLLHSSEIELLYLNGFTLSEDRNVMYIDFCLEGSSTQRLTIFLAKLFFDILSFQQTKFFELLTY